MGAIPVGYSVDVDESGFSTSGNLGGSGSLTASGQGNVNYGWAQECAPSQDGGPFSVGHYPPWDCAQVGRSYNPSGSPEQPGGFWFTGNQYCVNAGRGFSGADFTWHVQLPQTGPWHVDVYIPSWTSYGWGDQYILTSGDGQSENYPFTQQAYHGQWVNLFGSHQFTANHDYTVELTLADGADSSCHYQMADQMKWVYDGSSATVPVNISPPAISGQTEQGQTLSETHGSWTNSPSSYSYQWEDCDSLGAACSPISGANSQSYTLRASDVGHAIVVQETATDAAGPSSPASSAATLMVLAPVGSSTPTSPANASVPTPPAAARCTSSTAGLRGRAAMRRSAVVHQRSLAGIASSLTPAKAVARTVAKRSRHFSLSITLSKGLAKLFDPNQECQQTLRGSGYVNFRQRAARWKLALPGVFHGDLNVMAIGNRTYVNAPQFTTSHGRAHRAIWIELSGTADYKTFDRLPLLRDIVVLTNPLRSLDVLRSTRPTKRGHRRGIPDAAASHDALSAEAPSLKASCGKEAKSVANGDSVDAKRLTDQFSIDTNVDEDTIRSWAESKISAEADHSGVCEESMTVENAKADGFDIVLDFTNSTPGDKKTIKAPQATVTEEWKTVYHVKTTPCLDGTWEATEPAPAVAGPNESSSATITAKAAISGDTIVWTRDLLIVQVSRYPIAYDPEPPYLPIYVPYTTTSLANFENASGPLVRLAPGPYERLSTEVLGTDLASSQDSLGLTPPGNVIREPRSRPLRLALNCPAGELIVEQDRVLTVGAPLTSVLHKTSATPPPQVTVEQNWRTSISAPVQSGTS